MQFTITAEDIFKIITVLLFTVNIALLVGVIMKHFKLKRSQREYAKNWMSMHQHQQYIARDRILFDKPLKAHRDACPDDVKCALYFMSTQNGMNLSAYHRAQISQLQSWSDGPGKELVTMLADGLTAIESTTAGIIPILQVMLDERRDALLQQAADKL